MLCIHICMSGPSLPFTVPDDTPGVGDLPFLQSSLVIVFGVRSEEKSTPYTGYHIHNTTTNTGTNTHKKRFVYELTHHKTCASIIIKFWFHTLKLWNTLRDSPVSQVLCTTVSFPLTANAIVSLMQQTLFICGIVRTTCAHNGLQSFSLEILWRKFA